MPLLIKTSPLGILSKTLSPQKERHLKSHVFFPIVRFFPNLAELPSRSNFKFPNTTKHPVRIISSLYKNHIARNIFNVPTNLPTEDRN